jgi:hypothetical protein
LQASWLIVVVVERLSDWLPLDLHEFHIYCAVHSADAAAPFPKAAGGVRYFLR